MNEISSKPRKTLSLVIITLNEAKNIIACINSASNLANEIIVVDSYSTDGTQELSRQAGAKVFESPFDNEGKQRNRSLAYASCDWILTLDADERVTPGLAQEIKYILENGSDFQIWSAPIELIFCGKKIFSPNKNSFHKIFLFKNGAIQFGTECVHTSRIYTEKVGKLNGLVEHYTVQNIDEALNKMNRYSTLGAQDALAKNKHCSIAGALIRAFWAFIRVYFVKCVFLSGKKGLLMALLNAHGTFYKYAKLNFLQTEKSKQSK